MVGVPLYFMQRNNLTMYFEETYIIMLVNTIAIHKQNSGIHLYMLWHWQEYKLFLLQKGNRLDSIYFDITMCTKENATEVSNVVMKTFL